MKTFFRFILLFALLVPLSLPSLSAAEFKVVADIVPQAFFLRLPGTLIQAHDGTFYGTTKGGGSANLGAIFKMSATGQVTPLASFDETNGRNGAAFIEGTDGNLYGVSEDVIIKMTPAGVVTTLANPASAGLFFRPSALAQGIDGNLYGTTIFNGTQKAGTFFKLTTAGVFTELSSFPVAAANPQSLIRGSDGNFYGTGADGGSGGNIFKVTPVGVVTPLVQFSYQGATGTYPNPLVEGADGNFYSTTRQGGPTSDLGTFFRITPQGVLTTLASFTGGKVGYYPVGALIMGSDGNFYGQTGLGSSAKLGAIFRVTPDGVLTPLVSRSPDNGAGALLQALDGNLYGIGGSFLSRTTTGGVVTKLVQFRDQPIDSSPRSPLVQAADGTFYGTTDGDGLFQSGTVFRMTSGGGILPLVPLNGVNGVNPQQGLIEGSDGNYYGTATLGGTYDAGTLFRVTPAGDMTQLASFGLRGLYPNGLVQGGDGNFYGTTYSGGAYGLGTVFRATPSGGLITLASFNYPDGGNPKGRLIQGADGNFYGTTSSHGKLGWGTIFRVTPSGELTVLVTFRATNGANPQAGLLLGDDGNFYGTTAFGGGKNKGTIFRMTPKGGLTTLFSFTGRDGDGPETSLLEASNGYFYGTTYAGGTANLGTIFQMSPKGILTTLISLTTTDGTNPDAELMEALDGNLYGTTSLGGSGGVGTVYAITPRQPQTITFPLLTPVYGETVTLAAVNSSGLPLTYRIVSGPATLAGRKVTFTGTGRVVLSASNAGNTSYFPAEAQQAILVAKAPQALTPFAEISGKVYPSEPFTITLPVASSGLPVTVVVQSGPATLSGNTVTLTGTGAVRLLANQPGDDNYAPAKSVAARFVVKAP